MNKNKKIRIDLIMDEDAQFKSTGTDENYFFVYAEDNLDSIFKEVKHGLKEQFDNNIDFKKGKEYLKDTILNSYISSFEDYLKLHLEEEGHLNAEFKVLGNQELYIDIENHNPEIKNKKSRKNKIK